MGLFLCIANLSAALGGPGGGCRIPGVCAAVMPAVPRGRGTVGTAPHCCASIDVSCSGGGVGASTSVGVGAAGLVGGALTGGGQLLVRLATVGAVTAIPELTAGPLGPATCIPPLGCALGPVATAAGSGIDPDDSGADLSRAPISVWGPLWRRSSRVPSCPSPVVPAATGNPCAS